MMSDDATLKNLYYEVERCASHMTYRNRDPISFGEGDFNNDD